MSDIDVFISYKREERSLADQVSRALKNAGYVAVTDLNIQKATDFGEAIDRMIREAKVVVVLWTEASAASDWVRKEANEAERQDKYFGIRIEPVTLDDLPFRVRENNWLDLSDEPFEDGLPELVDEVRGLVGPPRKTEQQASAATKVAEGDLEFYQVVHGIGAVPGYERYIKTYPQGTYVEEAKQHIRRLQSPLAFLKRVPFWGATGTAAAVVAAWAAVQTIPDDPQNIAALKGQVANLEANLTIANQTTLRTQGELENLQAEFDDLDRAGQEKVLILQQALADAEQDSSVLTDQLKALQRDLIAAQNTARLVQSSCTNKGKPVILLREIDRCIPLDKQRLVIVENRLSDITPLAELQDLEWLSISGTSVKSVVPLLENQRLHFIRLPDGSQAGDTEDDSEGNRWEVQQAIATWKPE